MTERILANLYNVEVDKVISGEPINGYVIFCIKDEKGKSCGNISSDDLYLLSINSDRAPKNLPQLSRHRDYRPRPFGSRKRRSSRRSYKKRKSSKRSRRARRKTR